MTLTQPQYKTELTQLISTRQELPVLDDWAATMELLNTAVEIVIKNKPDVVVEAGSGVSSLVIGYALQANNRGKIYSLEHHKDYYEQTLRWVIEHGLSDWCEVLFAPLKTYRIKDKEWLYYDLSTLDVDKIDFLLIDGPPGVTQPLARYPAMSLLAPKLNKDAIVMMDDYRRIDEQEIIKRWQSEFTDFTLEVLKHPRGTAILKRISAQ